MFYSDITKHASNFTLVVLLEQVIRFIVGNVVSLAKTFSERSASSFPKIGSPDNVCGYGVFVLVDVVD